jgi:hypothetical protein
MTPIVLGALIMRTPASAASFGPSGLDMASTIAAVVGSLATLAAVYFAWRASKEGAAAAKSAAKALEYARDTASSSREAAAATAQTVEAARAAREADEHYRRLRLLRDVAVLIEKVFEKAADAAGDQYKPRGGWRCEEQRHLAQALIGIESPLPRSDRLAGASQAGLVFAAAADARDEISTALRKLRASG